MVSRDPHHRAYAALEAVQAKRSVSDKMVKDLIKVIDGTSTNDVLKYAWDKFSQDYSRTVLDSFFIANATFDVIRRATGIPIDVLDAYGKYIFDLSVFRDYLERIEYVGHCKSYLPRKEQALLEAALSHGPDFIVWLLNGKLGHPPKAVLETAMIEGLIMGSAHRGADITSETARQARAWLDMATKAATSLQRLDPKDDQDALAELRLALTHQSNVINADSQDAPQPEEILH